MQIVKISTDANQIFTTLLGGIEYKINLFWSQVALCWYVSIFDSLGLPVIQGTRVIMGPGIVGDLLTDFIGDLFAIPIGDPTPSIGRNDWGTLYNLVYLTPEEIAAIKSGT